jgi:hypothetical protein
LVVRHQRAHRSGDLYKGTTEEQLGTIQNNSVSGGDLLSRWVRNFADQSTLQAQFYYWRSERRTLTGIESTVNGYDFDTQYAFSGGVLGDIVIGGGYRTSQDRFTPGPHTVFLDPARRTLGWANGFIQDQIALGSNLTLTLGLIGEHSSYTGMEYMPDARIAWRPFGADMIWGSVSRAVRTPSRFDRDLINPGVLAGGPDFDSEDLVAYEAGYRTQPTISSSLSISVFYNVYDDLRTVEASTPVIFSAGGAQQHERRDLRNRSLGQLRAEGLVAYQCRLEHAAQGFAPRAGQSRHFSVFDSRAMIRPIRPCSGRAWICRAICSSIWISAPLTIYRARKCRAMLKPMHVSHGASRRQWR